MSRTTPEQARETAQARIRALQDRLQDLDWLCSGTLLKRMMTCGKAACRCARDPNARHGPYYEWGHMMKGKLVHRMVTPQQATIIRKAIANYRTARGLLRAWESQTRRVIQVVKRRN
jgi:hypothetical protein